MDHTDGREPASPRAPRSRDRHASPATGPLAAPSVVRRIRPLLSALGAVTPLYRAYMYARGHDETADFERRRSLVLAAHPDDEALGCAATILRKRAAGTPVHVVFATNGDAADDHARARRMDLARQRQDEAREACRRMGVPADSVAFLDFPDGQLATHAKALTSRLRAALAEWRPEEILVTAAADHHPDHRALAVAARTASRVHGHSVAVYEYPIWFWKRLPWTRRSSRLATTCRYLVADPFRELMRPPVALVRTEAYVEPKRHVLDSYASQIRLRPDGPRVAGAALDPAFVASFLREYEVFFPGSSTAPRAPR